MTLGKSAATSIVIETGVASLPTAEDATHKKLNEAGTLWQVLDGAILKIQTSAPKIKISGPISNSGLFKSYEKVTSITGLDKIDFSEVTDMSSMFFRCIALTSLDLSSFNTSKVPSMKKMFDGCNALTSLNLSSFNTSEVTNMESMFDSCKKLSSLTLSNNFVMTNVGTKDYMFFYCGRDLSGSDKCTVSGVTDSDIRSALSTGTNWDVARMQFAD